VVDVLRATVDDTYETVTTPPTKVGSASRWPFQIAIVWFLSPLSWPVIAARYRSIVAS